MSMRYASLVDINFLLAELIDKRQHAANCLIALAGQPPNTPGYVSVNQSLQVTRVRIAEIETAIRTLEPLSFQIPGQCSLSPGRRRSGPRRPQP